MRIEEEIKQASFNSEREKMLVNLIYTHNWLMASLKSLLAQHQLTNQQFNILRILRGQHPEPAKVGLIKERMLDKMSDASRLVERLRQKGLISRESNEIDKRAVNIIITDKGLEILKALDEKLPKFYDKVFDNVSLEECTQVSNILDALRSSGD